MYARKDGKWGQDDVGIWKEWWKKSSLEEWEKEWKEWDEENSQEQVVKMKLRAVQKKRIKLGINKGGVIEGKRKIEGPGEIHSHDGWNWLCVYVCINLKIYLGPTSLIKLAWYEKHHSKFDKVKCNIQYFLLFQKTLITYLGKPMILSNFTNVLKNICCKLSLQQDQHYMREILNICWNFCF